MEHVKTYPADFAEPLLVLMDLLTKSNINFFDKDKSYFERNWRFLYIIPMLVCHFMAMTVFMVNVFLEGKDVFADAFMIPVYIVTIQAILKVVSVVRNKRQLENVIDELGGKWRIAADLNDDQKAIKASSEKELRTAVLVFMRCPLIVAWQYLLLPAFETLIQNVILGNDDQKRLPFSCTYPYDPSSNWLVYGATYAYQVYCMFITIYLYLGSDFTLITLSAHLSVEFMLLCEDFVRIKPASSQDYEIANNVAHNKDIRDFVNKHQRLISIASNLDDALNRLMFVNMLFTTINLSFFGLAVMASKSTADKFANLMVVLTIMTLIFVQCYFCDKLKAASEAIFNAASKNLWYNGDQQYKSIICFVMFRSQKPCYLTSLKYMPITLQTFTKVLSTTWSYFSLVNTMYEESQ